MPNIWTRPPLPLLSLSLTLHVTSNWRSEFKVDRRCNVPILAMLGRRSRANCNTIPTFRHQPHQSDSVQWSRSAPFRVFPQLRTAVFRFCTYHTVASCTAVYRAFRVRRYSAISTLPLVSLRFVCPNPPACVLTVPDHSSCHAHMPSTLS